jgi:hypothetical protein
MSSKENSNEDDPAASLPSAVTLSLSCYLTVAFGKCKNKLRNAGA